MSKSEQTRARIAKAALRLFVEKGVAETRTRDIATEAEVAEGSIYRYFESKEALAHLLFEEAYVRYAEDLQNILRKRGSFEESWRAVVTHLCKAFDDDSETFRFLLISQHQHLGELPESLNSPVEVLRDAMAKAYKKREVTVSDADLATSLGIGAVIQAATFVLYGQLEGPMSRWANELCDRSLKALR